MSTKMKWVLVILIVVLMSLAVFSVALAQTESVTLFNHNLTVTMNTSLNFITGQCGSVGAVCGTG